MPKRIRKHSILRDETSWGMLYNADGETGGGGNAAGAGGAEAGGAATGEKPAGEKPDDDWRDKFEGQQKVNRDLETKLNTLRDGLKSALGVEDKKVDVADLVGSLKDQLDQLTHSNLVNEVARRHKLDDEDDIALLRSATDADVMDKLGARLAKAATTEQTKPGKPGTPKPDLSQGKGGDGAGAKPTSVAQVMADRQAAREKKTT